MKVIVIIVDVYSKAYHSLVQVLMEREASRDMASKEQAWHIFVEALQCISQCNNVSIMVIRNHILYFIISVMVIRNPAQCNVSIKILQCGVFQYTYGK